MSMPSDLIGELPSRVGRQGVSSYITEAVRLRLTMDGLNEIVASHEAEHGALTEQEIAAAHRELFGAEDSRATRQDAD
ncbi:CopG family transcriptional regulator [Streptomyces yaizuensis]|uniref:CopG family transcriptional regulator n=2 Tax=Streptomyces yaizuensis TaxID=2989713 RepID=A0ABQ5NVD7_9ACTN|nr:CopG family transcriptional regulator [Streptomyces sp. YSPA8]